MSGNSRQDIFWRHCKRSWPRRGENLERRRKAVQDAIRRDLSNLFESTFIDGEHHETLNNILRASRWNTREKIRRQTVVIALELVEQWLIRCPDAVDSMENWAVRVRAAPFDWVAQQLAGGILALLQRMSESNSRHEAGRTQGQLF